MPELTGLQKLSESDLWRWQRRFFLERGPEAWVDAIVPEYVTSNPVAARAAVQVALALEGELTVLELGGGSGRFAWYFLRAWEEAGGKGLNYVLSDLAPANLQAWKKHPALARYFESGVLQGKILDAESPGKLEFLKPGPLLVIANYFFDGLPYDLYQIHQKQAFESMVSIQGPGPYDSKDPYWFSKLILSYRPRPATAFKEASVNAVLDWYRQQLGSTVLSLPSCGLKLLAAIAHANPGFTLLAADRGSHALPEGVREAPKMVPHGSFSVDVNFHALKIWFELQGGKSYLPQQEPSHLTTGVFSLKPSPALEKAAAEATGWFGTDEFFLVKEAVLKREEALTVDEALAVLRLSGHDARLFSQLILPLLAQVPSLTERHKRELRRAIRLAWEGYYHLKEQPNLPFGLGVLLCRLGDFQEAQGFFQESHQLYGAHPHTSFNLAICAMELGDADAALFWCQETLKLEPDHARAKEMLGMINPG